MCVCVCVCVCIACSYVCKYLLNCCISKCRRPIKNRKIVNSNDTTRHTNDVSYVVNNSDTNSTGEDPTSSSTSDEESDSNSADDINDEFVKDTLSAYEIERLERIERNKRKFEEIFGHEKQDDRRRKKARKDEEVTYNSCKCTQSVNNLLDLRNCKLSIIFIPLMDSKSIFQALCIYIHMYI